MGIDLSKVVLTHHKLKNQGKRNLQLGVGEAVKLKPLTDTGNGDVKSNSETSEPMIRKIEGMRLADIDAAIRVFYMLPHRS
ncbi:hypothetical protein [Tumebacillus algifaecis]|uniref:hypothetical protein n=1 Tax=Tumebacillus algifaecis TaxID=1214604 RepID=UPI001D1309F6|nr:hypothetical protein [Tumebacillus algifaecis]